MRRKNILKPALLAAGVVVVGLAAFGVVQSRESALVSGGAAFAATGALMAAVARPGNDRRGFGGHGGVGSCNMWDERADELVPYLEGKLGLSSEQRTPWNNLIETIRTESESWEEICQTFYDGGAPKAVVWQLALFESMMKAGAVSAGKLRAAYAALDETLSPEQRESVEALLTERGGHGRSGGGRHFRRRP